MHLQSLVDCLLPTGVAPSLEELDLHPDLLQPLLQFDVAKRGRSYAEASHNATARSRQFKQVEEVDPERAPDDGAIPLSGCIDGGHVDVGVVPEDADVWRWFGHVNATRG